MINKAQEELQFLGFLGIFKESFNLIFTWRKIFTKITLAFNFPFSCIILAYFGISTVLSNKILLNATTLNNAQVGSPTYNDLTKSIFSKWIVFGIVNFAYFIFTILFLFLSISAVVYTIACIYTGKQINFRTVISVVPKVWKRLMITFLCIFCMIFAYTFIFLLVIFILGALIFSFSDKSSTSWLVGIYIVLAIGAILYVVGLIYMTFMWQLAYVISVMEKNSGFQAMSKSKTLLKGNMVKAFAIMLIWTVCSVPDQLLIRQLKMSDGSVGLAEKIWYGVILLVWSTFLSILHLVVQTILYFVCKSYHHENIDKPSLADHLEGYNGEYVPLKSKALELHGNDV